jgi:hypothetical protein
MESLDVFGELFTVLEVELFLAALFNGAGRRVALGGCIAKDGIAELFIHQNGGLVPGHAKGYGGLEPIITCLVAAICTVCSEVSVPFQPNIFDWKEPR